MLRLFRICRNIYKPGDPTGASRVPGRWHGLSQRVLYFSSSLPLCILELKANSVSFETIRTIYHYTEIGVDTKQIKVEEVSLSFYKTNWTAGYLATREFGKKWFDSVRSPILKVKSAALSTESNYILNTSHPDFPQIKFPSAKNIPLDPRIK